MKKKLMRLLAAGAVITLWSSMAAAVTTSVDVDGVESWDAAGSPNNVEIMVDLGAGSVVTGIGWDVTIDPLGASWYSEATVTFSDSDGLQAVSLAPGAGDDEANDGAPRAYSSPILVLADLAIADIVLTDGILLLTFSESFDDVTDAVDATWGGELLVEYNTAVVPVPAAVWLFGSGLLGLMGLRRNAAA